MEIGTVLDSVTMTGPGIDLDTMTVTGTLQCSMSNETTLLFEESSKMGDTGMRLDFLAGAGTIMNSLTWNITLLTGTFSETGTDILLENTGQTW